MTYKAIVKNGVVVLPENVAVRDGTEVEVTVAPRGTRIRRLLQYAGTWHGDDAQEVIEMIYRSRSSRMPPVDD